jgi:hypothetical protein
MKPEKNGWYKFGRPDGPKEVVRVLIPRLFLYPNSVRNEPLAYQRVGDSHLYKVEDTFDNYWHGEIYPWR